MLIEGVGNASLSNGIVRVEVLARNAKGQDVSHTDLLIPLNRVDSVAEGLRMLADKLREKISEGQADSNLHSVQ